MTAFKAFALVLFILPLAWARFGEHHRVTGLSEEEIDAIFNHADADSRDKHLKGSELPVALNEAVRNIFKANSYYVDEEMIRAIVDENLQNRVPTHLNRASFGDFLATVPSTVKNFRENIFDYLLRHYDVEGLMEDQEIANEVYKNPDIFGLTYAAYRVLSFNFDQPPNQVPTYTETRTTFESEVKEPENLDKRIQEEINRITESVGEPTVLTDGIISVGKETGGVDTFAENVAHTPGVAIEIDQTVTVSVDGVPTEVEVKTEVKATDLCESKRQRLLIYTNKCKKLKGW